MERRIEIDDEQWDDVAKEEKMGPGMAGKLWLLLFECRGSRTNCPLIWLIVEARQVSACSDDDGSCRVNEGHPKEWAGIRKHRFFNEEQELKSNYTLNAIVAR